MTEPAQDHRSDHLMAFVLGLLTPLLMAVGTTDIHVARLAAQETIAAYKARGQNELMTIAQILAFALTALDNLRLSMAPELSLSMKLKLRGNANALNRAAQHNTQMLEKARRDNRKLEPSLAEQAAMAMWEETETAPDAANDPADIQPASQEAEATPTIQPAIPPAAFATPEHRNRLHWANAMKTEAVRLQVPAANITPAQQRANTLWVDVLTGVASDLTRGKYPTAGTGMSRSDLLRTTMMAGGPGFPTHLSNITQRSATPSGTRADRAAKRA